MRGLSARNQLLWFFNSNASISSHQMASEVNSETGRVGNNECGKTALCSHKAKGSAELKNDAQSQKYQDDVNLLQVIQNEIQSMRR